MSQSQEQFFSDMWYHSRWWAWLLLPLSAVFWCLSTLRRTALQTTIQPKTPYKVPVVVIGNITVGGAGKTPLLISLCETLKQQGIKVGVVSRGYGSSSHSYPLIVDDTVDVLQSGDEPALIFQRTGCPVVIDANRHNAVTHLLAHFSVDVIISDDGLQHYGLWRDLEIVVIDGKRGLGNGFVLPAGPLRETRARLASVDFVCINSGASGGASEAGLKVNSGNTPSLDLDIVPQYWRKLGTVAQLPLNHFAEQTQVNAIAGIGNPERFFNTIKALGLRAETHEFQDHHHYCFADLPHDLAIPVVMTEKDAVKIEPLLKDQTHPNNYWALGVGLTVPPIIINKIRSLIPTQETA